jgi:hypothetical protein
MAFGKTTERKRLEREMRGVGRLPDVVRQPANEKIAFAASKAYFSINGKLRLIAVYVTAGTARTVSQI